MASDSSGGIVVAGGTGFSGVSVATRPASSPSWTVRNYAAGVGFGYSCEQVAAAGKGADAVTWERFNNTTHAVDLLTIVRLPNGGAWSQPHQVDPSTISFTGWCGPESVAVGASGQTTIVWEGCVSPCGQANYAVYATQRSAAGKWGSAHKLSSSTLRTVQTGAAVTSAGRSIATWGQDSTTGSVSPAIFAATQPSGGSWAAKSRISPVGGSDLASALSVDSHGNAIATVLGEGPVLSAYLPATGRWKAAQTILDATTAASLSSDYPRLALAGNGAATAVYGLRDSSNWTTLYTETSAVGGAWSAPSQRSPSDPGGTTIPAGASYWRVAGSAAGNMAVTWVQTDPTTGQDNIDAALHPSGGSWDVSSPPANAGFYGSSFRGAEQPGAVIMPSGGVTLVYRTDGTPGALYNVVASNSWATLSKGTITPPPPIYVALGDSVAAGEGLENTSLAPLPNVCHRSSLAYPAILAGSTAFAPSPFDFFHAACTGATTSDIWNSDEVVNGGDVPAQLDQVRALGAPVGSVTITVGIDDLNWASVIQNCLANGITQCESFDANIRSSISLATQGLAADIVQAQNLPGAPFVVTTGYYDPFPSNYALTHLTGCPGGTALLLAQRNGDGTIALIENWLTLLNTALAKTASTSAAHFVDIQAAMHPNGVDHGMCTNSPWVFGFNAAQGVITGYPASTLHPNVAGQAAIAAQIEASP